MAILTAGFTFRQIGNRNCTWTRVHFWFHIKGGNLHLSSCEWPKHLLRIAAILYGAHTRCGAHSEQTWLACIHRSENAHFHTQISGEHGWFHHIHINRMTVPVSFALVVAPRLFEKCVLVTLWEVCTSHPSAPAMPGSECISLSRRFATMQIVLAASDKTELLRAPSFTSGSSTTVSQSGAGPF